MFSRPVQFYEFLAHHDLVNSIYKSMESPDLADPVMTVLDILRKTNHMPPLTKERKTESKSTNFRNEGNTAYSNKQYQKALVCYNQALLFAPKNSRAMKLAYSNRSALLHKVKAFSACLNDIETCFSMGCPQDIVDKLRKRKDDARGSMWVERLAEAARNSEYTDNFFQFHNKNPQIPCANTQVGVIVEDNVPKIVATDNIKVGSVLAVESAFVSQNDRQNQGFSCYYCHKMDYNLKPCDGCVLALFCSEDCRQQCGKEYHDIECQFNDSIIETIYSSTISKLGIKAVLKMRQMCNSWKEFIAGAQTMGLERIKSSSINQIYDANRPFSLLNIKEEKHFLNGPLYNSSFTNALIVHYLENIPCFFPRSTEEKSQAIRAIARLLMFFSLHSVHIEMVPCVSINMKNATESYDVSNYGWFSFLGKLPNACHPNCITVGLNKDLGLVAIAPITRGTELTIPYLGHWMENQVDKYRRQRNFLVFYGTICNCIICTEDYKHDSTELTDSQKKNFRKLNLSDLKDSFSFSSRNMQPVYNKLSKTMAFLNDVPFSAEYKDCYALFRRCLLYIQDVQVENVIID